MSNKTPNKIRLRDLDPSLASLLSGGNISDEALKDLLSKYRSKEEVILEQDIDQKYKDAINTKISGIKAKLESHLEEAIVITESELDPVFLQKIANIEKNLNGLQGGIDLAAEINKLQDAVSAINSKLDAISFNEINQDVTDLRNGLSEIQKEIEQLKITNDDFMNKAKILNSLLDSKRDKDAFIEYDDLSDEVKEKIDVIASVRGMINEIQTQMNVFPHVSPGSFLSVMDEGGDVSGKELFHIMNTVENETDVSLYKDDPNVIEVFVLSNGEYYSREGNKYEDKNPVNKEEQKNETANDDSDGSDSSAKNKHVPPLKKRESYLQNTPDLWNSFIVDKQNNKIVACVFSGGVLYRFGQKKQKEITLSPNESVTISASKALTIPITLMAKDNDIQSKTYGKYFDATAMVTIYRDNNSYTLLNEFEQSLDLLIIEG